MTPTTQLRLTKLAELLERVFLEGRPFNLGTWVDTAYDSLLDVYENLADDTDDEVVEAPGDLLDASTPLFGGDRHGCGTVACAVGYATLDPWFQEQGLIFARGRPEFKSFHSWEAVREFFCIDYKDAENLFDQIHYPDGNRTHAMEVVGRIREFLATGGVA